MGAKQGLEHVIEAARIAAAEDPALLFVLMGDGGQRASLESQATRMGLPNVRFLPLQAASAVADVLAAADVLLVNQRGSVRDMALPSKLTSYFAAGRPVVAAVAAGSETAAETEWSGGGIVCAPDDPRALLAAIRRITADAGLAAHLAASAQRYAREVLSREAALRAYEQLLASVLASGSGRVHLPTALRPVKRDGEREERWSA
jgi:glycosyltransferase involved in cell wall biosynthesis